VVLVGNAAAFAPALRSAGFGTFETVEIGELDLSAANFRRAPRGNGTSQQGTGRQAGGLMPSLVPAAFRQSQPADNPARTLLDEVIAAKGGVETLRGIKGLKAVTLAEMSTPEGVVEAQSTTYLQYPDRVRVETKLPDATLVQVYDGQRAWVTDPAGTHDVPEQALRDLRATLRRDTLAALLAARDGRVRARLLPDVRNAAGERHRALELSAPDLEPVVLYVDPTTNLVARQTYVAGRPGDPLVEEIFSDYKTVDGVQIAFTAAVRRDGQQVLERRVTEIDINPPLDPALFRRPAS
jgi:hypothetical protein